MIGGKKVLAIIPARGGSKGLPRKNILSLRDMPLIAWTIQAAKGSRYLDRIVVSSDDQEIIDIANQYGAETPFVRPPELALDDTPGIAPVLHALGIIQGFDYMVLLQPTSPLRSTEDIDGCIEKCFEKQAPSCVSVTESPKSPYWMYRFDHEERLTPLIPAMQAARRQELPPAFALNGAVYVALTDWVVSHEQLIGEGMIGYTMSYYRSIDVDTKEDIEYIEWLLEKGSKNETGR